MTRQDIQGLSKKFEPERPGDTILSELLLSCMCGADYYRNNKERNPLHPSGLSLYFGTSSSCSDTAL
jgi:hypothetical protein